MNFKPIPAIVKKITLFFLLLGFAVTTQAQQYPVQGFLSIIPPYPAQLADYANPNINRLNLTLTLNDISVNNKRVRLKVFVLRQNSLFTQTSGNYFGDVPITLTSGIPEQLTSSELAGYFKFQNLQGIVPDSYAQPLGEGFMNIYFVVYDYFTGRQLSNKIEFPFFILLNDPPLLNLPLNGTHISNAGAIAPQIAFSWTSRATQASNTDYIFTLSPIYDPTGDPFTQFLAAIPVYQTTISNQTNLLYGFAEPPLLPGKTYGWRIQAKAKAGFEDVGLYKQNGYSEIHTFTYDSPCITIADQDVTVEPRASDRLYASWVAPTDAGQQLTGGYMVAYRKYSAGGMWNWQEQSTQNPNYFITGLEPTTDYEVKVARICTDGTYTYTNPQKATTLAVNQLPIKIDCGKIPSIDISNQNPLPQLNSGDVVMAGDFPVTILRANNVAGLFSGEGWVKVPYLADTKIHVTYQNIKVNTDHKLIDGYFETSYKASGQNIASVDTLLADVGALINDLRQAFKQLGASVKNYNGSDTSKADMVKLDTAVSKLESLVKKSGINNPKIEQLFNTVNANIKPLIKNDCSCGVAKDTVNKGGPPFVSEIVKNIYADCTCHQEVVSNGINSFGGILDQLDAANAASIAAQGLYQFDYIPDPTTSPIGSNDKPAMGICPNGKIIYSLQDKDQKAIVDYTPVLDPTIPYVIAGFEIGNINYNWSNGSYSAKSGTLTIVGPSDNTKANVNIYTVVAGNYCTFKKQAIDWKYDPSMADKKVLQSTIENELDPNAWVPGYLKEAGKNNCTTNSYTFQNYSQDAKGNNPFSIDDLNALDAVAKEVNFDSDNKLNIYLLNKDNPAYNDELSKANADPSNKTIINYDATKPVKLNIQHFINAPKWLADALPTPNLSACIAGYINSGLEDLHKSESYLQSDPVTQTIMEVRTAAYRSMFGMYYCATNESSVQGAGPTKQFVAGALHEVIAMVDLDQILTGILQAGKEIVNTNIQSYLGFCRDMKQTFVDIKNGTEVPFATLAPRFIPPQLRNHISYAETAIKLGQEFSDFYFTKCDTFPFPNGQKGGICSYRRGQITAMVAPIAFTAGAWVFAKVGAIATELGVLTGDAVSATEAITVLKDAETVGATTITDNTGNIVVKAGSDGDIITTIAKDGNSVEINGVTKLTEEIQPGDLVETETPVTTNSNEIITQSGSKGAWNKILNEYPLKPNTIYNIDEVKYVTNAEGDVVKVTTDEIKLGQGNRNGYQQSVRCKKLKGGLQGDEGGHILGTQFGGIGEQINYEAMSKTINGSGGTYYQMETEWANVLKNGGKIKNVTWDIILDNNKRAVKITVKADINGTNEIFTHKN